MLQVFFAVFVIVGAGLVAFGHSGKNRSPFFRIDWKFVLAGVLLVIVGGLLFVFGPAEKPRQEPVILENYALEIPSGAVQKCMVFSTEAECLQHSCFWSAETKSCVLT